MNTCMNKLLPLALHQVLHRDPCRLSYNPGDVVACHTIVQHGEWAFSIVFRPLGFLGQLPFELGYGGETQARCPLVLPLPLSNLQLILGVFELLFKLFDPLEPAALYSNVIVSNDVGKKIHMCTHQLAKSASTRSPPSVFPSKYLQLCCVFLH